MPEEHWADALRIACLSICRGGYTGPADAACLVAFRRGIATVCDVVRADTPPDAPDLAAEVGRLRAEVARLQAQIDRDTAAMDAEIDRSSREAQDLRDARDDALRAEEGMYRGRGNR